MMKYLALMFAALVGAISCVYAQATRSAAASQAWVENYVSNAIASIRAPALAKTVNGESVMAIEGGTLTVYAPTDAALQVLNSTCSITNGTLFIWDGGNKYINQSGTIEATKTNMVYQGVYSTVVDGKIHFDGYFDVAGVLVTSLTSLAITNNVEVVK